MALQALEARKGPAYDIADMLKRKMRAVLVLGAGRASMSGCGACVVCCLACFLVYHPPNRPFAAHARRRRIQYARRPLCRCHTTTGRAQGQHSRLAMKTCTRWVPCWVRVVAKSRQHKRHIHLALFFPQRRQSISNSGQHMQQLPSHQQNRRTCLESRQTSHKVKKSEARRSSERVLALAT